MNRYLLWSLFLFALCFLQCKSHVVLTSFDRIEVYYIPWDLSTEARWTELEARNTKTRYVSYFCTEDKAIINNFISFFRPDKFKSADKSIEGVPPYMIIDLIYNSGHKDKVVVGPSIFFEFCDKLYIMDDRFRSWLQESIPKAGFPDGVRRSNCSE